jgi:hypothetical protein
MGRQAVHAATGAAIACQHKVRGREVARHAPEARMGDELAARRHVTVIVRLVMDRGGRLVYGEVVNAESKTRSRFTGWRGLPATVRACVGGAAGAARPPPTARVPRPRVRPAQ